VIVLNNGWAISTPTDRQTAATTFAAKAAAAGIPGERVDGNDVLAVHAAMTRARAHAASTGPILLELVTYRMGAHTNSDDPTRYVPEDELAAWRARDPIESFRARLVAADEWSDDDHQRTVDEVETRVDRIVDSALARPIDPNLMFDHVLATDSRRTARDRAEFAASREQVSDTQASDEQVAWRP
jgi:TPP-dependent pyruvate/acetoin dehydrogenase alpha subunit